MGVRGNRYRRRVSRRTFLSLGGMSAAALAFGSCGMWTGGSSSDYGPLLRDSGGLLDLPKGFQYRIISEQGSPLSDGSPVPGHADGMAAFRGPGGTTILVRNHELEPDEGPPVTGKNPYRPSQHGGTTGIVIGSDRRKLDEYVTSSGTNHNCAGGATPWGTWLTCEETLDADHGYVFEVMPAEPENKLSREPIRAMGFFSHEAAGVDPETGIVYLTEDDFRGEDPPDPRDESVGESRVSFLYRYVPNDPAPKPGALHKGGKLQVMALEERSAFNVDLVSTSRRFGVVWKDVDPEDPHDDAEDKGAARFNRLEGAHFSGGAFWFDDTMGGEKRRGQIFRYFPKTETLELFYESAGAKEMKAPDQITTSPWGDLWFVEDGDEGGNRVMGITPEGRVYAFARNRLNDSELSGPAFSPDGRTFFVNIYDPGITFAVWGPFARPNAADRYRMSHAAPPPGLKPRITDELSEAAERHAMSPLEAAAYDRLGVPLT